MPFSTDVTVPRDHTVEFPDRCVGCGESAARGTWSLSGRSTPWFSWLLPWIGTKYTVEVPCCASCKPSLVRNRRLRELGLWIVIGATVFIVFPQLTDVDRPLRKPLAAVGVLAILFPGFAVLALRPPKFDLTVHSSQVDLEFADQDYAEEVARLNGEVAEIDEV